MDAGQARRAAAWLSQRVQPDQAAHDRYPWLPFGTAPTGSTGAVRAEEVTAMDARVSRRRRAQDQPRDWRGRWV
jgi:hypothetical protein